jgi:WD40 repeat protein
VDERNPRDGAERRPDLQADDRLPLSLDLLDATSSALAETRAEKNLVAQSTGFGKDRVNCITLWFPSTLVELSEGAYDQDVAVLAHNDSSVVVVSLRDQEVLDKITYPDYMNRGVISPDGRLLVAISDDPYLYIHERKERKPESGASARAADRPVYEWSPCEKIQLKGQSKEDRTDNRFTLPITGYRIAIC